LLDRNTDALPEPGDEAKNQSLLLMQRVRAACERAGGWLKFSEYMNIALYEPALGYYSGGLQKFGQKGDFITAPEVSPLFGQCLANQLAEVLANFKADGHSDVSLVEFGAGSGVLAADVLLRLEALQLLPEFYCIIELSAELQQRQKKTIEKKAKHLLSRVRWLDQLPEDMSHVIVVANEVLDAMPVECFKTGSDTSSSQTLIVGFENDELVSKYLPTEAPIIEKLSEMQQRSEFQFSEDYKSEYNPAVGAWLAALESKVERLVIFLIDYGYNEKEYYHQDRVDGTLMCYYQHRGHDNIFWWPGLQDITAFVNFTDIAYSADSLGMGISGYTTQAAFLLANGLSELHEEQVTDDIQQQIKLSQQIKTLTLPSEMGDRFKVMAITKNYDEPLKGFSMLDLRNRL
jgi:SAM-dependent MidA family methyltransferase